MPHPSEHESAASSLGAAEAEALAETMRVLGSASRLRILAALVSGEQTVEELTTAAGLTQSATSHNLRLLRNVRLVRTRREGRHIYYALHDHHLPDLLQAIRHHHEHVNPPAPTPLPQRAATQEIR